MAEKGIVGVDKKTGRTQEQVLAVANEFHVDLALLQTAPREDESIPREFDRECEYRREGQEATYR
jgi:hypothetical protein